MSSQLIYEPGLVDYPERLYSLFSLLDFPLQKTSQFSNPSPRVSKKRSKEDIKLAELFKSASSLPAKAIYKIQESLYIFDLRLYLSSDLPRFSSKDKFDNGKPSVHLPGFRKPIPFSETPMGCATWQEHWRFPLGSPAKNKEYMAKEKARGKKRESLLAALLPEFIRTVKEVATPKQWQIARRFFISKYFQQDRVLLKDMAKELNVSSSTFIQQLWGRPRNDKWIGGVFPKAIKKIRRKPEILALIKKEKRLLNSIFKELSNDKDIKTKESVNCGRKTEGDGDDSGVS